MKLEDFQHMCVLYSDILNFIYNIPDWRYYQDGGCYKFYLMLKEEFPNVIGYYNSDHVITKIGDKYFDSTGEVKKTNHLNIDEHYSHTKLMKILKENESYYNKRT